MRACSHGLVAITVEILLMVILLIREMITIVTFIIIGMIATTTIVEMMTGQ